MMKILMKILMILKTLLILKTLMILINPGFW